VGLGEFNIETYGKNGDHNLEWGYFILATFVTNIVFLNMLISIMGDTFQKMT
jgi:hypothetical protein